MARDTVPYLKPLRLALASETEVWHRIPTLSARLKVEYILRQSMVNKYRGSVVCFFPGKMLCINNKRRSMVNTDHVKITRNRRSEMDKK